MTTDQAQALERAIQALEPLKQLAHEQRLEFDALDFVGQMRWGSGKRVWGPEDLHSNLLAWLLDPKQSHGLGTHFLIPFLGSAGAPPAIATADLTATESIREWENQVDERWGYLDILIVNEPARMLCAIENKTFSHEHSQQLTRYRQALETAYPDYEKTYVFLTPRGTKPFRREEQEHWSCVTYTDIYEIIQRLDEDREYCIADDIRIFLRQYATTLRRNLVPDTSIAQQARRIYLENRESVELLIANRPNWPKEIKPLLKDAIDQQPGWEFGRESSDRLRVFPTDWRRLVFLRFVIPASGRLYFQLRIGARSEENDRVRTTLFESVRERPNLFRLKATALTESWMSLHEEKILGDDDLGVAWDDGTTRAKIEAWLEDFFDKIFPAMNEVIVNCFRKYEAEEQDA